jgi:hypothetical protein
VKGHTTKIHLDRHLVSIYTVDLFRSFSSKTFTVRTTAPRRTMYQSFRNEARARNYVASFIREHIKST